MPPLQLAGSSSDRCLRDLALRRKVRSEDHHTEAALPQLPVHAVQHLTHRIAPQLIFSDVNFGENEDDREEKRRTAPCLDLLRDRIYTT